MQSAGLVKLTEKELAHVALEAKKLSATIKVTSKLLDFGQCV